MKRRISWSCIPYENSYLIVATGFVNGQLLDIKAEISRIVWDRICVRTSLLEDISTRVTHLFSSAAATIPRPTLH